MTVILPTIKISLERWKYSSLYGLYVSTEGRFRDKNKNFIKPMINSSGYLTIQLKYGTELAHRIVAAVWLPEEDMYHLTVDHKDHNKRNNSIKNLEWCTKEENQRRAIQDEFRIDVENTHLNIKMFLDENCSSLIKSFVTYPEAAKYIKHTWFPNDNQTSVDAIVKKLSSLKDGARYCARYWKFNN